VLCVFLKRKTFSACQYIFFLFFSTKLVNFPKIYSEMINKML